MIPKILETPFRKSRRLCLAALSCAAAAVVMTGGVIANDRGDDPKAVRAWEREPNGEAGPGLRIDCQLSRFADTVPTEPERLVFEPTGVVRLPPGDEQHGPWSIGTVYTERGGRREETLDEAAEWFPPDKLLCELKFGGKYEARYRAVFECGRAIGSLFDEGRLVASLEQCRSVEVPKLPYYVAAGMP